MDYRERFYQHYLSTHFAKDNRERAQTDTRLWNRYFRLNYLRHLPQDKNARILDVGCGMGQFLQFLAATGYPNVAGIDRSDEAAQYCRSRNLAVERSEALGHLASRANIYDAVVLNDLAEHFTKAEIVGVIEACYRALRPNGALLVKTVNAANPIVGAHSLAIDFTHEWIFSEESLTQLLRVVGFREIRVLPVKIYTQPYNPIHWLARLLSGGLNMLWRMLFFLYGRRGTKCFSKSILAVGKK